MLDVLTSQTNQQGTTVLGVQLRATDPDGDTLTYSATGLPRGLSIRDTTCSGGTGRCGLITGTISSSSADDSPFTVFVQVFDPSRASDAGFFPWTVTP